MSYEYYSRKGTVLKIRHGGNYFEPVELYNSLILCDIMTHNRKFMNNPSLAGFFEGDDEKKY